MLREEIHNLSARRIRGRPEGGCDEIAPALWGGADAIRGMAGEAGKKESA